MRNEIISNYMDSVYQVTVERNPGPNSTGNGLLHAGLFYVMLYKRGELYAEDCNRLRVMLQLTEVDGYPGLLHRSPWKKNEHEAHDDYIGIMAALYFADSSYAKVILNHGRKHFGSWNNIEPEKWTARSFFPRFPFIWPFFKMCARETVFFGALVVAVKILADAFGKRADSHMRAYCMLQVARERSWLCEKAAAFWEKRVDIHAACGEYFGKDHPFTYIK